MNFRAQVSGPVDLLSLHCAHPERYPFLLQSVAGHPQSGRYDILFAYPDTRQVLRDGDVFHELTRAFHAEPALPADELPFQGGWFLLLGYEAARWIEPRLRLPASPFQLPDALAVRCPAALIHDRETRITHLVAESDAAQLRQMQDDLAAAVATPVPEPTHLISRLSEDDPAHFLQGVQRALEYLRAGDIFQANLSRAWRAELAAGIEPADLYRRLRRNNPAPFAGLARWGGSSLLSSSPERLIQIENGWAQTRPIAGTRPRGSAVEEDAALRSALLDSFKERAEHIMLIDLERNDLGRICLPGSVTVSELMSIESYAHVHHIVSNVRGQLRPGVGPGEALKAVFPGGTITGCPKLRAMEIIAELEGTGRGPYTGAMGYLSRCGRLDTNILIRSLVVEQACVTLRAGAGIVADSVAELELAETRAKARGLLLALGASA